MRVLIIPEDFINDQYIQPIVEAFMENVGERTAHVAVCREPRLRGVSQAMKIGNLEAIIGRYPMVDLFLLIVDRDGIATRRQGLDVLEDRVAPSLKHHQRFLAENAWQEVEVWILAGHDIQEAWAAVRLEPNPKERYFEPLAAARGLQDSPGGGRKILAAQAARRFGRVLQLCPEDIGSLRERYGRVW